MRRPRKAEGDEMDDLVDRVERRGDETRRNGEQGRPSLPTRQSLPESGANAHRAHPQEHQDDGADDRRVDGRRRTQDEYHRYGDADQVAQDGEPAEGDAGGLSGVREEAQDLGRGLVEAVGHRPGVGQR
jgi:hypothetical protein